MKYGMKIDMGPLGKAAKRIKEKVGARGLGQTVLAGLFVLEAEAKLNVRANFKQRTGHLASDWETVLDEQTETRAEGHTAPLAVYARIQELGGVIRSQKGALHFQTDDGQWHTVKAVTIPARPYLRPAADNHRDDIVTAMSNTLNDLIEKAAKE